MHDEAEAACRREYDSYGNWRPLPPKPKEKPGYVEEKFEDFRDIYDNISVSHENEELKAEVEPPGQNLETITDAVMFSKLTKLNTNSVQGSCEVSDASVMINESTMFFVSKLKIIENQIDNMNKAIDNILKEKISRIEGKLTVLQNQLDADGFHWQEFQGSYYYFSRSAKKWGYAKNFCATVNSRLIIIDSKQEQDFVVSKMTSSVWLGLSDAVKEGQWHWIDGSPLEQQQSFWKQQEPNNSGSGEDCAILCKESKWNDIACETDIYFVCEKTVIL
ncbi:hepatic lectin-like [Eublepharis macularius]|uniref:Hepatic lectin-like n=1 Tax=Eublepharis macularius TaxID=481883 RepID=A0AA97KWZ6_EUBMA|nr:hepatic lectin-like [Eublepharis macularius]